MSQAKRLEISLVPHSHQHRNDLRILINCKFLGFHELHLSSPNACIPEIASGTQKCASKLFRRINKCSETGKTLYKHVLVYTSHSDVSTNRELSSSRESFRRKMREEGILVAPPIIGRGWCIKKACFRSSQQPTFCVQVPVISALSLSLQFSGNITN